MPSELDRLNEVVIICTDKRGHKRWKKVWEMMGDKDVTTEKWRTQWRVANEPKTKASLKQGTRRKDEYLMGRFDIDDSFIAAIKRKTPISVLINKLDLSEDEILGKVFKLNLNGYNIQTWKEKGDIWVLNPPVLETGDAQIQILRTTQTMKIAILGDTHFGSKCEALDELKTFYEYAYSKGVREFYHVGDITDGYYKNRDGSIFEQHALGFDEQLNYVTREYPRLDDAITYFITGNHDATHQMNGGGNIGKVIERFRDDMVYLGHNYAKVWLSEKVDLELRHPHDGSATAISFKAQRIVDAMVKKPKIVAIGHYHKMNYMFYKNVHSFLVPSFQHQTPFMAGKGLASYVGGYIVTINLDDKGDMLSIVPEFLELGGEYD